MKWFVAVLVLLNALTYYWLDGGPEASSLMSPRPGEVSKATSLVLLSELPDHQHGTEVVNVSPGTQADGSCWVLGPLDKPSIERLSREMDAAGLSVTARGDVDMGAEGYWVYLPAPTTRSEREALISALLANNVDYFVFGDGKFGNGKVENAISLGFFKLRENAEKRQKVLKEVGFSTIITSTASFSDSFWVSMPSVTFGALSKEFWRDIGMASPGLMVDTVKCARAKG